VKKLLSLSCLAAVALSVRPAGAAPAESEFLAAAGAPAGTILAKGMACYDYLGTCTWQAKVLDPATGATREVVLGEAGAPLGVTSRDLAVMEEERRFLALGPISEDLWRILADAGPGDVVPVFVWLRTYEDSPVREELLADGKKAAAWASAHVTKVQAAKAALVDAGVPKGLYKFGFILNAPAVRLDLTKAQVLWLASLEVVAEIRPWVEPTPAGNTWFDAVDAGCAGCNDATGVKVCLIEPNRPDDTSTLTIADYYRDPPTGTTSAHARWMVGIIRSSGTVGGGAASLASTYVGNYDGSADGALNWCATSATKVWNYSQASDTTLDRLFDYWVRHSPYPFVAAAAGNGGSGAVASNQGFNVLCVGGSDDRATTARSDDLIYGSTSSKNPNTTYGDRELPVIAAPAVNVSGAGYNSSGTSAAAAIVSAAAAQLQYGYATLASWPEAVRAILMASADENVDGTVLTLSDGTDDRDGAGELNIALAMSLGQSSNDKNPNNTASQAGFDTGSLDLVNGWTNGVWNSVYRAKYALSGMRIRVVLTWDSTASCSNPADRSTCTSNVLDAPLDLRVYAGANLVASSASWENSYEIVEFEATANQEYTIKLVQAGRNANSTYYGIAWNTWNYGP